MEVLLREMESSAFLNTCAKKCSWLGSALLHDGVKGYFRRTSERQTATVRKRWV